MPTIDELEGRTLFPIQRLVSPESLPDYLANTGGTVEDALREIFYTDVVYKVADDGIRCQVLIVLPVTLEFSLQGLDYITVGIGEQEIVPILGHVAWSSDNFAVRLDNVLLSIRFSRELLVPVEEEGNNRPRVENDKFLEIEGDARISITTEGCILLDSDFDIDLQGFDSLSVTTCKLKDLPIAFSFEKLTCDFSKKSSIPEISDAGFGDEYQGVFIEELVVYFAGDLGFIPDISAKNFAIGSGGISGQITATFDLEFNRVTQEFVGDAAGSLFGAAIGLRRFELEIHANEIVSSDITGQIVLPFFDKPIEIELSLDLNGNMSIGLKGTEGDVLAELTKDDLISMKLNSFNFHHIEDQETAFVLGGSVKPLIGDISWPEVGINALKIVHQQGGGWDVKVDGGWIELPKKLSFDVYGFKGELAKIGFGSESNDSRFVGFSGAVAFVSGFAVAAAFDDLKIIYPKTVDADFYKHVRMELKRAALGFAIPGAVSLVGEVSLKEHGFGGLIDVSVIPTQMKILGAAEFGKNPEPEDFTYMQIYLESTFPPPGIYIGGGLAPISLMGVKGKFAMNMVPSMEPGWTWAITPPRGVTPLSKMIPGKGGKMLGAGIKIATSDGYMVTIDALFALLLPGPVVMIEGKGGILADLQKYIPTEAAGVVGQSILTEPPFYALVVINAEEQYFSANLAVEGNLVKGILGASGTVDIFFDLQQPSNWWIKLGQREPKDKRIQTVFFTRKTQGYFEMSAGPHIEAGGLIGFDARKDFKVGYAVLKAYIEGGAGVAWKPEHLEGWLNMVADIGIKVCGFGLGLGASAGINAMIPYPRFLEILAEYHYFFNIPWPLPDIEGSGEFRHTSKSGEPFPVERFEPLIAEVAVDSEVQGIPLQTLALYEEGATPQNLSEVPVVALDARPTISFRYPVNDDTDLPLAGNTSNGRILHAVGDARYDFSLRSLKIERFEISDDLDSLLGTWDEPEDLGKSWEEVPLAFGVWLAGATTTGKEAATHLRLWSKTPFTQFRQTRYPAATLAQTALAQQITSAGWINSDPTDGRDVLDLDNITVGQLNSMLSDGASYLSAVVEEESPGYPLGQPQSEWQRIGFMQVPLQSKVKKLIAPHSIEIVAVPGDDRHSRSFDVIDIPFYLPVDESKPYHKVKEKVRGIHFQGSIEVHFPYPVSNCELYLYPIQKNDEAGYSVYPPTVVLDALKHEFPPKIITRAWQKGKQEKHAASVEHGDKRDTGDGFYVIDIFRADFPIGSVAIDSVGKGLFLAAIGYQVDVQDAFEDGKDKIVEFNDNAWGKGAADEEPENDGILKPSCCYRLTVGYDAGQGEKTRQLYFRTDGPPADYIANYVAWPIPEGIEYPIFRDYSIGIHFNSNYIDRLYEGVTLDITLQSSGGTITTIGVDDLMWKQLQQHKFSPEEQVYIDAINNSGVDDIDPNNVYADVTLVCNDASVLESDETYEAKLSLQDNSPYKKVELELDGQEQLFTQISPSLVTSTADNLKVLEDSDVPLLGADAPADAGMLGTAARPMARKVKFSADQELIRFTFRTSRYETFTAMVEEPDRGGPAIRTFGPTAPPVYDNLLNAVNLCHQSWAPKKTAIWEVARLMKFRLAQEEDLLKAKDQLAGASQALDDAFDQAVAELDADLRMVSVQPLPRKTTVYFSPHGLLLEFSSPVEFGRLEISVENTSVLTACTSAETRILIIPAIEGEEIPANATLKANYMLDVGSDKPRYYLNNNMTPAEEASIALL